MVRVQYNNACFSSDETTWANKMFGTSDGQMNHYLAETTYSKYQFTPASEASGCTNDGVITVNIPENHPNTQKNSWACHASKAITKADSSSSIDFASYDTDNNNKLSVTELQVIFMVAGGESASSINTPGGIWGMATALLCDVNEDGDYADESGEHGITLDNVRLLGLTSSVFGQNGFSQFGERQGSSSTNTWDATIGVMAHELGHAYFGLPDLYDTSETGAGIGAFGLMGSGVWGRKLYSEKGGSTPVHLSAWSKENISACVPQTVDNGTNNITLPAVYKNIDNASSCGIYKATTSTSGEYFLFENRSSGGYDKGLNYLLLDNSSIYTVGSSYTGGLAIWHVKDILSSCSGSNNCETQSPKLVDLEEANDGDLDNALSNGRTTHLFFSGNNATFDNSSTPNSKLDNNSSSGISATSISTAGDNMTLTISK
jgi:M6 family metalloprotease-like protein